MKIVFTLLFVFFALLAQTQSVHCGTMAFDTAGCAPLLAQVLDESTGPEYEYSYWYWGDGTEDDGWGGIAQHTYTMPGTYTLMHIVTADNNKPDTCYTTIHSGAKPDPPTLINYTPNNTICFLTPVTYVALPDTYSTYVFVSSGYGYQYQSSNTLLIYGQPDTYVYGVVEGCQSDASNHDLLHVVRPPKEAYFTNAFETPFVCPFEPTLIHLKARSDGSADTYSFFVNSVLKQTGPDSTFTYSYYPLHDTLTVYSSYLGCETNNPEKLVIDTTSRLTISISGYPTTVCSDESVNMWAIVSLPGLNPFYQWQKNGKPLNVDSNIYTATYLNTGDTINCLVTSDAACVNGQQATSNKIGFTVNYSVAPDITYSGDTLISTWGAEYLWYFNGQELPNSFRQWLISDQSGSYMVRVIDTNYCAAFSDPYVLGIPVLQNEPEPAVGVYPNPSRGVINITASGFKPNLVSVYDITGQKISEGTFTGLLNTALFAPGVYFIEISNEERCGVTMFVRE